MTSTPTRAWLARRTLRFKITAGVVVLLLCTCASLGAATGISLRQFLLHRLDTQLTQAGGRFGASLEHSVGAVNPGGSDGDADNSTPGQSVGTLGARLLNDHVTNAAVIESNGHNRTLRFSGSDQHSLTLVPATSKPTTVHLNLLGDYRVIALKGRDGDVQLTGLPMRPVEETVARLLAIEGVLFVVIVVAGGATSAFYVRWTLRPLNRVAATALSVSELPLTSGEIELPERELEGEPGTEVGKVSAAFEHMLDHVETALRARNTTEDKLRSFIADASHELRTPLATIRSHTEYVRRTPLDLPPDIAFALTRVEAESIRMGGLVDDLLLLASLDAGRPLARATVDVTLLVLETISDARAAGTDHHWRMHLPEHPIEIQGDTHRLHQVLTNLLANARTHTPPATTVNVRLSAADDVIGIDVTDDGPGIPAELLPSLFERFTRADTARTHSGGNTGLGLAIAYGIVAAHGGTLTVESRPANTTFHIRLPIGVAD